MLIEQSRIERLFLMWLKGIMKVIRDENPKMFQNTERQILGIE